MKKTLITFTLLITLLFSQTIHAHAQTYRDVPVSHPFYHDIELLVNQKIIDSRTQFGLYDQVTRAEVAEMMARALQLDGEKQTTPFRDVSRNHPRSGYITKAVEAGIISGYSDGTFRPNEKVTRGQMALFLARTFQLEQMATTKFKDVGPSMSAYKAIQQIVAARITTGYSDGTFRPNATLQRGQIAAFTARAIRGDSSIKDDAFLQFKKMEGTYTVGKDIKAGEYMLVTENDGYITDIHLYDPSIGYDFEREIDPDSQIFITLKDGQQFSTNGLWMAIAKDVYVDTASTGIMANGEYRVGIDIPAGTYTLYALDDEYLGHYLIKDSSDPFSEVWKDEVNFLNTQKITLKKGDYLFLSNAGAEVKHP